MKLKKITGSLLCGAVLAGVMATTGMIGCEAHVGYYYDPYDHRYYAPDEESVYYMQWENDTHRRHEEWRRRRNEERREYWEWRHQHYSDNGRRYDRRHQRDHDHDRD